MALTKEVHKRIEIPSDIKYIKRVSHEILEHLKCLKIDKSIQFDVRLATEEAVRNAIEHGHKYDRTLPIIVTYTVDKNRVEIEVEDKGKGFDVINVPDPRVGNNIMKGGGRGVFLVHKVMDKVTYNKKGNKVRMIKFFKTGGRNAN